MVSLSRAVRSASLLIVVSSAASAFGQVTINEATLFWIADQGANGQCAEMRFSQPLTAAPTADQIHIMMKPSGRVLRLSNPRRGIGQPDFLVVNWTSDVLPSEDDTSFSVTLASRLRSCREFAPKSSRSWMHIGSLSCRSPSNSIPPLRWDD